MTIVDTDGEYFGLKEQYELLVAGRSAHVELPLEPEHAAALARASVEQGFSVILDVSGYKGREAQQLLEHYFLALWNACSALRRPYEVVLEEAHLWIPQERDTPLKEILTDIALRGRKRGLGILLASQRSAKVEKDVLTQVPLLFLHQVVHPIDITVYKGLLPLPAKEVERIVGELQRGVHSAETEVQALAAGVEIVAIPAVGKISPLRQAVEGTRRWRRAYRWRAGIEGRIASLRRDYGLRRCDYYGQGGMERWIGFGIIGSQSAPYRPSPGHQRGEKANGLRRKRPIEDQKEQVASFKNQIACYQVASQAHLCV
jgi:hypothetical protein